MRRFRIRRRRNALRRRALALPSIAVTTSIAALGTLGLAAASSAAPKPKATLKSGTHTVKYGHSYRLSGTIPGAHNAKVMIAYRPRNARGWKPRYHLHTGANGRYARVVKARKSGTYRAHSARSAPSAAVSVRVHSHLKAKADHSAVAGHSVPIKGRVKPGDAGRLVKVKVGGHTLRTHTKKNGHFRVRWHAGSPGRYGVQVVAAGNRAASGSKDRAGRVTVFRYAVASYYGPGFYGNRTACGQTLEPGMQGVANKTLPCGTKVTLRYHGHQATVPVIDRGPYAAGRDYDLTEATKSRLGFGSTGTLLSSK
jgi:hypothetical protein